MFEAGCAGVFLLFLQNCGSSKRAPEDQDLGVIYASVEPHASVHV